METENSFDNPILIPKLSRRENARKRRTEHEIAYNSVQNPCSPFFNRSCCHSSAAEHRIGNAEVVGSIPTGSTTARGDLSEIMVMAKLMRLGASVWTPAFGHDHPFDLIAHFAGRLSRIQVKTANDADGGSLKINGTRACGNQSLAITQNDCDVIIAYHHASDHAYVLRPVGKTRYQLRATAPKNGQVIGIMYEQDFRLVSLDQIQPA